MSLVIDASTVDEVLLLDGWHHATPGTFSLDSYEFVEGPEDDAFILHGGGNSGVCATGFTFQLSETGEQLSGPLTAVLAVKHSR